MFSLGEVRRTRAAVTLAMAIGLAAIATAAGAQTENTSCRALAKAYPEWKGRRLVIGVAPSPAHYSATDPEDPEKIIGIEPDLLQAAAQCLGFSFTYSILDFAGLIPALHSGRIDIIAAGMYSSAQRAQQIDFVEYMKAREASLVRAGNPRRLLSLGVLCGVTAAEVTGTVENELLDQQNRLCLQAGKLPIATLQFPSTDRAVSALAQGRADVFLTDAGVASHLAKLIPQRLSVGFSVPSGFMMAFGVSKQQSRLARALCASLQAQYEDGSLGRALGRWGFLNEQLRSPAWRTH